MSDDPPKAVSMVQPTNEVFTEEALRSQDGKTVRLTLGFGGPVIGEATMKFDAAAKGLVADFKVTDPRVAKFLNSSVPQVTHEFDPMFDDETSSACRHCLFGRSDHPTYGSQ